MSSFSQPKLKKLIQLRELTRKTAPNANFSAFAIEYGIGSSIIKSQPFFKAISVFVYLEMIDGVPR